MTSLFFKGSPRDKEQASPTKSTFEQRVGDEHGEPAALSQEQEEVSGAVAEQNKTRKRKGSLRKTALLGGKRIVSLGRERKGSLSLLSRPILSKNTQPQQLVPEQEQDQTDEIGAHETDDPMAGVDAQSFEPPLPSSKRDFSYTNPSSVNSSESSLPEPLAGSAARLSLLTDPHHLAPPTGGGRTIVNEMGSPVDIKSPTSGISYTSTTDDDDLLTLARPAKSYPVQSSGGIVPAPLSSSASSYFPVDPPSSTHLRRASKRSSPLSRSIPISAYPSVDAEPHDYTETEYWGWLILFVTWITFTVGMGSCLGIWTWAWDVGERPAAPDELSDDDTLPIVGYYPALMVLTGVVAWVWITVAWVGMKYFRHAKIEV